MTFSRQRSLSIIALVLALASSGCSLTLDASHLGVPATLASGAGTPPEGTAFNVTSHAVYGLWGVFKFSEPSLQKALAAQLVGGKEVTNVRVRVRSRLSDVIITALTLGLIVPRSVTIEGVIIEH